MTAPVSTGFGMMVTAVLCPPLYFILRGKVLAGIVHSFIYLLAWATLIFGIGLGFWMVGFVHASWDLAHVKQEALIQRQASVLAEKMFVRGPDQTSESVPISRESTP
jgi:hypothetical protein